MRRRRTVEREGAGGRSRVALSLARLKCREERCTVRIKGGDGRMNPPAMRHGKDEWVESRGRKEENRGRAHFQTGLLEFVRTASPRNRT